MLFHLSVIAAIAVTVIFLDRPVASFIDAVFYSNPLWAQHTSSIPDTLIILVIVVEVVAWSLYLYRRHHHQLESSRYFILDVAFAVFCSYLLKSFLKVIFGRVNTRIWLTRPDLYEFHWLNGGSGFEGFPSGHMAVFTTLVMAFWRHHPRYRPLYTLFLAVLAAALVATNYHFVSDVIAGAYVGVVVESTVFLLVTRRRRKDLQSCSPPV